MYSEYYNLITNGSPGGPLFLWIVYTIIFAILIYLPQRHKPRVRRVYPFIVAAVLIIVISGKYLVSKDYYALKKTLINKEHSVTEGVIEDFTTAEDSLSVTFTVNGINFTFDDLKDKGPDIFSLNRDPFNSGASVRIFYFKDKIIGIWIKE